MSETLVIRSSEWLRGQGAGFASGLNIGGRHCCLGLEAKRHGIDAKLLAKCAYPADLYKKVASDHPYMVCWTQPDDKWVLRNSEDARFAALINDKPDTSDEHKIADLRPIFAKHGIEIDWRPNE